MEERTLTIADIAMTDTVAYLNSKKTKMFSMDLIDG
jgi:hypothetical protein